MKLLIFIFASNLKRSIREFFQIDLFDQMFEIHLVYRFESKISMENWSFDRFEYKEKRNPNQSMSHENKEKIFL